MHTIVYEHQPGCVFCITHTTIFMHTIFLYEPAGYVVLYSAASTGIGITSLCSITHTSVCEIRMYDISIQWLAGVMLHTHLMKSAVPMASNEFNMMSLVRMDGWSWLLAHNYDVCSRKKTSTPFLTRKNTISTNYVFLNSHNVLCCDMYLTSTPRTAGSQFHVSQ